MYVDLVAAGTPAQERYAGITAYLSACGPCGEDFEGRHRQECGRHPVGTSQIDSFSGRLTAAPGSPFPPQGLGRFGPRRLPGKPK